MARIDQMGPLSRSRDSIFCGHHRAGAPLCCSELRLRSPDKTSVLPKIEPVDRRAQSEEVFSLPRPEKMGYNSADMCGPWPRHDWSFYKITCLLVCHSNFGKGECPTFLTRIEISCTDKFAQGCVNKAMLGSRITQPLVYF